MLEKVVRHHALCPVLPQGRRPVDAELGKENDALSAVQLVEASKAIDAYGALLDESAKAAPMRILRSYTSWSMQVTGSKR
ncbi:hypothetical protein [Pseudomonas sp.]|uniref:hypothetical protein n=1 Tax=unclassified Pseudomonas TaxID=196821 RepID=UPI00121EB847|nr:hypothetical protein [Pseudomonas sp.]RZI70164.1 MAG: hypothetical protein EOP13_21935 [Pseudomonas sp.]